MISIVDIAKMKIKINFIVYHEICDLYFTFSCRINYSHGKFSLMYMLPNWYFASFRTSLQHLKVVGKFKFRKLENRKNQGRHFIWLLGYYGNNVYFIYISYILFTIFYLLHFIILAILYLLLLCAVWTKIQLKNIIEGTKQRKAPCF